MNDGVSGVKHETVGEHEHDFPLELGKRGDLSRTNAGFNLGDVRRTLHDPAIIRAWFTTSGVTMAFKVLRMNPFQISTSLCINLILIPNSHHANSAVSK